LLLVLLYSSHTLKDPISNARHRLYIHWAQRARRRTRLVRAEFFESAAQGHNNRTDDEIPADVIPILALVAPAYFIMKNLGIDVLEFVDVYRGQKRDSALRARGRRPRRASGR
jgi:hypothetical protein